jgi:tRNA (guanine26-N2/guanine27-N2)-dimethyltransferase
MQEESVKFSVPKSVFYNPQMHFCRSFASLAVGAIEQDLVVCDAFCASGIRGIRYAKENKNVTKTIFIDMDKDAITSAKKNGKANRIKHEAKFGNFSKLVFDVAADFLEVDPFGSPAPYIYDAFRVFNPLKQAYLSVTATDVAVLCGAKTKACMKNYHSRPMNNEFTHETGLRIMIKKIAEVAAEFNMGIEPVVSISKQHYLKSIIRVTRGAEAADKSLNKLGYINYCKKCGWRGSSQFPVASCQNCVSSLGSSVSKTGNRKRSAVSQTQFAGPLWLGEIHEKKFLDNMLKLNKTRDLEHKTDLEKMLLRMKNEISLPPFYYNVHQICKLSDCKNVPKMDFIISKLKEKKFKAGRTHFSETSIKTDAPLKVIEKVIRSKQ